jgi:hypothetical protein
LGVMCRFDLVVVLGDHNPSWSSWGVKFVNSEVGRNHYK